MNVAPNDEYRLVRLKAWQRRSPRALPGTPAASQGRMRAEPVEAPFDKLRAHGERPPWCSPDGDIDLPRRHDEGICPPPSPASPLLQVGHQRSESAPPHPGTSFARKKEATLLPAARLPGPEPARAPAHCVPHPVRRQGALGHCAAHRPFDVGQLSIGVLGPKTEEIEQLARNAATAAPVIPSEPTHRPCRGRRSRPPRRSPTPLAADHAKHFDSLLPGCIRSSRCTRMGCHDNPAPRFDGCGEWQQLAPAQLVEGTVDNG